MGRTSLKCLFALVLGLAFAQLGWAQSTTYHLRQEASSTAGLNQLLTAGPDTAAAAVQSTNLKNQGPGEYPIHAFDTQAGDPNLAGTVPSGSTVTFRLWMQKTANWGTLFPRAKLSLNSAAGTPFCTVTGTAELTNSLTQYTLACTTSADVPMSVSDRIYLWVGVDMTQGPGNKNVFAELDIEGTLDGNYDSQVDVPLPPSGPSISNLSPTSGDVTGDFCTSGNERESTKEDRWYVDQEVQTGTDRNAAAAD